MSDEIVSGDEAMNALADAVMVRTLERMKEAEARCERLEAALMPFLAFEERCRRMLEMDPDHQVTQGSSMAAPQLYARDFLALRAALCEGER